MTRSLCAGESGRITPSFLQPRRVRRRTFFPPRLQQHGVGDEANIFTHLAADQVVIPGEDFTDTPCLCRPQGRGRRFLWAGQESDVPSEYEVVLVILHANLFRGQGFVCHCQHAEAVVAEVVILLLQFDHEIRMHFGQLAVKLEMRTAQKTSSGAPLVRRITLLRRPPAHRHHASSEVEWYLIQLLIFLHSRLRVEVGSIQNRPVEQVPEARLE